MSLVPSPSMVPCVPNSPLELALKSRHLRVYATKEIKKRKKYSYFVHVLKYFNSFAIARLAILSFLVLCLVAAGFILSVIFTALCYPSVPSWMIWACVLSCACVVPTFKITDALTDQPGYFERWYCDEADDIPLPHNVEQIAQQLQDSGGSWMLWAETWSEQRNYIDCFLFVEDYVTGKEYYLAVWRETSKTAA